MNLLLLQLGTWIETNMFSLLSLVIVALGAVVWLIRLESSVNNLLSKMSDIESALEATSLDFTSHTGDTDKHVNKLYLASLVASIDKLANKVEKLEDKFEAKLDKLTEAVHGK